MQYEPFVKWYRCDTCTSEERRQRGCKKPKRKPIMQIKCTCEGSKRCGVCKGKGAFWIKRCPCAIASDRHTSTILPYYYSWKASDFSVYPDGRGRLFQPVKLLEAFSLLHKVAIEREQKDMEARMQRGRPSSTSTR